MREKNPDMVAGKKQKFVMRPPQVVRIGTKKTSFANFTEASIPKFQRIVDNVVFHRQLLLNHPIRQMIINSVNNFILISFLEYSNILIRKWINFFKRKKFSIYSFKGSSYFKRPKKAIFTKFSSYFYYIY